MNAASKTYDVRTHGCQMNVHDSERLAGLLETAGYVDIASLPADDRGEIDRLTVLFPPHLAEQWVEELRVKFGIDAVAVLPGTARRLAGGQQAGGEIVG